MRSEANQSEMPLDAPLDVVLCVSSEADAVRKCLQLAAARLGRDQRTVANLCGWKSESCLSEIARESNARRMPPTRRDRFALATGCNLLNQYFMRVETERLRAGRLTERDAAMAAAESCIAYWSKAA